MLHNIQENISLAERTTLRIGGPARWFAEVTELDDFAEVIRWADDQKIPIAIMGNGSNILVADQGFPGLVIRTKNSDCRVEQDSLVIGAGASIGQLISCASNHHRGGLKWLIGVPGSVGGAIYGNAGSRTEAIGQYVAWVDVIEADGMRKKYQPADCKFEYRHSIFKNNHAVILQVSLKLPTVDPEQERALLTQMAKQKHQNQPLADASAGCMFKNPAVDPEKLPDELQSEVFENNTISAWRLIQHAGLQGKQLGQMQISQKHANFMVNLGGATADQVVQLLSFVKQQVRDRLGVQLQEEVQYVGF